MPGALLGQLVQATLEPARLGMSEATHGQEGRSVGAPRRNSTSQMEPETGTMSTRLKC